MIRIRCCRWFLSAVILFFIPINGSEIILDVGSRHQTIEGFGGGFMFNIFPYNHPKKDEIYDSIFNQLRVNVVRVGNFYNPEADTVVAEERIMAEIRQTWPHVKTMLSSWSPPAYLKSNNSLEGRDKATLKKNEDSTYMYEEYADYWLESVRHFRAEGVQVDWVSIQNEPDWPADWEGCSLAPRESPEVASYGRALDAVYNRFNTELNDPIPLIGPDITGIKDEAAGPYLLNESDIDLNKLYAIAHHFYNGAYSENMLRVASAFEGKPIFQTEYLINENSYWEDRLQTWFDHVILIHNALTVEGVSMYALFALAYKPASTHCCFSIDTLGGDWYEARPIYYGLKHFSRSINRGWRRFDATASFDEIFVSGFCNEAADSLAVIAINTSAYSQDIKMAVPGKKGTMHLTSETVKYEKRADFTDSISIILDPKSISTFDIINNEIAVRQPKATQSAASGRSLEIISTPSSALLVRPMGMGSRVMVSLFDIRGRRIENHNQCILHKNDYLYMGPLKPGTYIVAVSGEGSCAVSRRITIAN